MSGITDNPLGESSLISGSTRRSEPATWESFSRITYSMFRFASCSAAARPAGPAPMMMTGSAESVSLIQRPVAGSGAVHPTPGPSDPTGHLRHLSIKRSDDELRKLARVQATPELRLQPPCASKPACRSADRRFAARHLKRAIPRRELSAHAQTMRSGWWRTLSIPDSQRYDETLPRAETSRMQKEKAAQGAFADALRRSAAASVAAPNLRAGVWHRHKVPTARSDYRCSSDGRDGAADLQALRAI